MRRSHALTVRLPNSIHDQAKLLAEADGASVNTFIVSAVSEKIAARRTVSWLKQQAGLNGSPEKLLAILADAPDMPPELGDELPAPVRPARSRSRAGR